MVDVREQAECGKATLALQHGCMKVQVCQYSHLTCTPRTMHGHHRPWDTLKIFFFELLNTRPCALMRENNGLFKVFTVSAHNFFRLTLPKHRQSVCRWQHNWSQANTIIHRWGEYILIADVNPSDTPDTENTRASTDLSEIPQMKKRKEGKRAKEKERI